MRCGDRRLKIRKGLGRSRKREGDKPRRLIDRYVLELRGSEEGGCREEGQKQQRAGAAAAETAGKGEVFKGSRENSEMGGGIWLALWVCSRVQFARVVLNYGQGVLKPAPREL